MRPQKQTVFGIALWLAVVAIAVFWFFYPFIRRTEFSDKSGGNGWQLTERTSKPFEGLATLVSEVIVDGPRIRFGLAESTGGPKNCALPLVALRGVDQTERAVSADFQWRERGCMSTAESIFVIRLDSPTPRPFRFSWPVTPEECAAVIIEVDSVERAEAKHENYKCISIRMKQ